MRFQSTLLCILPFFVAAVSAATEEKVQTIPTPYVVVSSSFLEKNPGGVVANGEQTPVAVFVENRSTQNLTVRSISGSFIDTITGKIIRNTTVQPYSFTLIKDVNISIPYAFHTELKAKEHRLRLWIDLTDQDLKYQYTVHDGLIKVVEPPTSIFDYQMLMTYVLVASILGGAGYAVYQALQPPKRTKKAPRPIVAPTTTTSSTTGFEPEWIPATHLKGRKSSRGDGIVSASSGEESAPEKKARGKKRN